GSTTLQPGAVISPGSSAAANDGGTGLLLVSGNLTMSQGATYVALIAGTNAGTTYDRIAVTGSASLNGATLQANVTYSPAGGDSFSILTASGTLSGTFNGHPDGSIVFSGPIGMRIDYLPHAVTLTVCASPAVTAPAAAVVAQTLCL
ncbi:MAG TPA: hypothetical protein VGR00_03075, partial [Thermoanaerobaculia bacterium]|nr:hypothetical protein [Thermoanaerobaculia bacterium]